MDSIKKVNNLCKSVLKLTDKDFANVDQMAKDQSGYMHPLKIATQGKYNDLGNHNQRVIAALRNLRDVIKSGEPKGE